MSKSNLTEIVFILDKSGSMVRMCKEPIDGYNNFIKEQSDPALGEAKVTLVLFDSEVKTIYSRVNIKDVKPITSKEYEASGMTAINDAIGLTFKNIGKHIAAEPEEERPSKVVVFILTDGEENSSRQFSAYMIKDIIEEQKTKYSWDITFIGTTREAISTASSYGIFGIKVDNNSRGLTSGYNYSSNILRNMRSLEKIFGNQ